MVSISVYDRIELYFFENSTDPFLDYVNFVSQLKFGKCAVNFSWHWYKQKDFFKDLSDRFVLNLCVQFFISNNLGNSSGQLTPLFGFIS